MLSVALGIFSTSLLAGYKDGSRDEREFFSILQYGDEILTEEYQAPVDTEWPRMQNCYLIDLFQEWNFSKKIMSYLQSENLSAEIQVNVNNILEKLPNIFIENVRSKDNIYSSSYGTVLIDFEEDGKIFSLEVGTKSIGYFSEIDSTTNDFCEEIIIEEDNFEESIDKVNSDFLAFYDKIA